MGRQWEREWHAAKDHQGICTGPGYTTIPTTIASAYGAPALPSLHTVLQDDQTSIWPDFNNFCVMLTTWILIEISYSVIEEFIW